MLSNITILAVYLLAIVADPTQLEISQKCLSFP